MAFKIMESLRKNLSDFRANVRGVGAEIDRLEAERKQIAEGAIRFNDWRDQQLAALDEIAEFRGNLMVERWRTLVTDPRRFRDNLGLPMDRFGPNLPKITEAPFYGDGSQPVDNGFSAGMGAADLLMVFLPEIKAAYSKKIEPLRASWPKDSECGLPLKKRIERIAEIDAQLDKLRTERDAMLEVLHEVTGDVKSQPIPETADEGEGGLRA